MRRTTAARLGVYPVSPSIQCSFGRKPSRRSTAAVGFVYPGPPGQGNTGDSGWPPGFLSTVRTRVSSSIRVSFSIRFSMSTAP